MSSNNISNGLLVAPVQLNIYLGCFLYVIGVIGSIGNMIIYRSRTFRDRACSVYLFWKSIVDLLYMNSVLLTRILQKGFRVSITTRYDALCKIRQFSSNYGNQLAFTFLALATLDRILLAHRSPSKFMNIEISKLPFSCKMFMLFLNCSYQIYRETVCLVFVWNFYQILITSSDWIGENLL